MYINIVLIWYCQESFFFSPGHKAEYFSLIFKVVSAKNKSLYPVRYNDLLLLNTSKAPCPMNYQ